MLPAERAEFFCNPTFGILAVNDTVTAKKYAQRQSARKSKTKNGRLANLASNPIVTVTILKLWAKPVNSILIPCGCAAHDVNTPHN